MYGSSLSALSDAWESVAAAKKELTNVDAKIRQTGVRTHPDAAQYAAANFSQRSKDNPNIERRVVMDYPVSLGMYRKENIPPLSHPQPKFYNKKDEDDNFTGKVPHSPAKQKENYAPDFNYNPNITRDKGALNTSLSGRVLFAKKSCDSNALNRLKEKINQQKMNASISKTTSQDEFPARKEHLEAEHVNKKPEVTIKEPMKRKVTQAPPIPTYKGFHQVDGPSKKPGNTMIYKDPKDSKFQKREQGKVGKGKEKKNEMGKMNRKVKVKGKMQRVVSPKKPVQPITTTTWRIGQEIRANVLKERKNKKIDEKLDEEKCVQQTVVSDVVSTCHFAEKPYEETEQASKGKSIGTEKGQSEASEETVMNDVSLPKDVCHDDTENIDDLIEQDVNDNPEEENVEVGAYSEEIKLSVSISEGEPKDLSKILSKNAISIISDLNDISKEKKSVKPQVTGVVDSGLKRKKVGKKSTALKRKSDEANYPKQKIRHYDKDEVQKYMQKKQAERRHQRMKEKQQKEQRSQTQQQKLKELYSKQKEAVKENLEIGKRNVYGETFVKLSNKISSIMSDPTYNSSQETSEYSTSKDLSKEVTLVPPVVPSPLPKENPSDDIMKDSLEVTGLTNGDQSIIKSLKPISPYKPVSSLKVDIDSQEGDEKADVKSASKVNRVAAIHSTAAALRKRLDMEAKRISCLVQSRQANLSKSVNDSTIPTVKTGLDHEGFTGEIPGTHNIDDQAALNLKLQKMDEAAKRIQAFYRGHCTRKSLHWKLPSGRTLFQAFEGARRSAFLSDMKAEPPVTLASSGYPPITISNIGKNVETSVKLAEPLQLDNSDIVATSLKQPIQLDNVASKPDKEIAVMDINSISGEDHGSTASLISEAFTISKNLQQQSREASSKVTHQTSKNSSNTGKSIDSFPSYSGEKDILANQEKLLQAVDEKAESLRKVLEKHKQIPGDEYSVINIFTRNYPSLRREHLLHDLKVSSESDTEIVLADAYVEEMKMLKEDSAYEYLTEQSLESLTEQSLDISVDETLTEQSINSAADLLHKTDMHLSHDPHDDSKSSVSLSLADLPPKIQMSSTTKDGSISMQSKKASEPAQKEKPSQTSMELETDTSQASVALSSRPVSELDTHDLKPVFSSTQRSMDAKELEHSKTLVDMVDFKVSKADDDKFTDHLKEYQAGRMSPNTLERKLRAEINLYESVGNSLQQVGEMARVRNVADAQQESVTLAQVLKSRQVTHQQELERLSIASKQRAMEAAQEVEVVKRAAAETSVNVMKSIAEVKAKAAEEIAASAVQLAQLQQQTTSNTMEALNQVEQARQAAASAYKQSVDQQLPTVGELAATIALKVVQQQKPEETSGSNLPSGHDYTEDFEANKTISSKQSTSINKSGSSKLSTPSDRTVNSKSGTPSSAEDKTDGSKGSPKVSIADRTGSSRRSILSSVEEQVSNSKRSSATSAIEESIRSAIDASGSSSSSQQKRKADTSPIESMRLHQSNSSKSISEQSGIIAKSSTANSPPVVTGKDDSDSQSDTIVEELTFKDLDTPRSTKLQTKGRDKGASTMFDQKILGSAASVNEDSFSGNSEDKINSSLTEEELKHDFRMVLPSENHRRKSLDCIDSFITGNDTSSDELLVSPRAGKWMKKLRSKSPFADENTFTKFTANMVRQYIQEDEVRAKHQAALLELREKAIIEKTKAEMAYLEMQKKTLKTKGTDEKMPPITKKQRAILLRLQAEQSEIRRLKEAHKAASLERRSMLYQQKQIEKIRETTQRIWSKLEHMDKSDSSPETPHEATAKSEKSLKSHLKDTSVDLSKPDQEVSNLSQVHQSSDIPDEAPPMEEGSHMDSIEESVITEDKSMKDSPTPQSVSTTQSSHKRTASSRSPVSKAESISELASVSRKEDISSVLHESKDETSSIAQDLKKLMYASGKKYLTDREKKLESRKQQFTEIMSRESQLKDWRQKIIEEELKLKEDIRKVLEKTRGKDVSIRLSGEKSRKDSPSKKSMLHSSNISSRSPAKEIGNDTLKGEETFASIREDLSSAKDLRTVEDSILEEVLSETAPSQSQSEAVSTEISKHSRSVDDKSPASRSASYKYSTDVFESDFVSAKNISISQRDGIRVSRGASDLSKRVEDDSMTTENTSDSSDIEQRLQGLEDELENRRLELERLRKKKEKELLRLKEQELKKALQDVEQEILRENKENIVPGYKPDQNDKLPTALLSYTKQSTPERAGVDIHSRQSDLSTRTATVIPTSEKALSEKNVPSYSDLSAKGTDTNKNYRTRSVPPSEDNSEFVRSDIQKSDVTNTNQSVRPTIVEEIRSSIHSTQLPDAEYTEKDIDMNSSRLVSELKSIADQSKSISTALDVKVVESRSENKNYVSGQRSIESGKEQEGKSSKKLSVEENVLGTPKASIDLTDLYGDDFEDVESGVDGTARSGTRKSVPTEEDLSELSEEIVSEYSQRSEKKETSENVNESLSRSIKDGSSVKATAQKSISISKPVKKVDNKSNISVVEKKIKDSKSSILDRLSSEESVKSEKEAIEKNTPKDAEAYSYDDSFVDETSKMSTTAAEESLKSDSPRIIRSNDLERISKSDKSMSVTEDSSVSAASVGMDAIRNFNLNDRVMVEDITNGVIKFIGKTPFSPVIVAGISLDEAVGTNDGTFQGTKYFECLPNCGVFTTLDRIKLIPTEKEENVVNLEGSSLTEEIEEVENVDEIFSTISPGISKSRDLGTKSVSHASNADVKSIHSILAEEEDKSDKNSLSNKSIREVERDFEADGLLKSSSSSDIESSEAEIPSPQKLDVGPMADGITESILQSLLLEAIQLPLTITLPAKEEDGDKTSEITKEEMDENRSSSKHALKSSSTKKEATSDIRTDVVTKQLLDEALSHMLRIKKSKDEKLILAAEDDDVNNNVERGESKFLSLIADDDTTDKSNISDDDKDDSLGVDDVDDGSFSMKNLLSVQDHLSAICGEDDELDQISKTPGSGNVFLPPKGLLRAEEPVLQIPWTIEDTRTLVFNALDELTNDSVTNENLAYVKPSDEYLLANLDNKNYNKPFSKLYKQLIFDSTKSILCEINEFHELQKQTKPPWMKAPRKTFSKFTHNSHMLDAETLCQTIADHISTCLDLQEGRPSLEKLKRRLPLNLNKKDYVDAVLVEEIREEEPQWVNYDEDELKVKFQLADDILNSLLQEVVEILNII